MDQLGASINADRLITQETLARFGIPGSAGAES